MSNKTLDLSWREQTAAAAAFCFSGEDGLKGCSAQKGFEGQSSGDMENHVKQVKATLRFKGRKLSDTHDNWTVLFKMILSHIYATIVIISLCAV